MSPVEQLAQIIGLFRKHLYLPDPRQVCAVLGAVAANMIPQGMPVWLIIIGPPSSGKTEPLKSLDRVDSVHEASDLTAPGLLPVSGKRGNREATGGLLRKIGPFGVVKCNDMSSLLSMRPEKISEFFAMMRHVYDGQVVREGGAEGGISAEWKGKVGFIAAVTDEIDVHHAAINRLGPRFLYFRMEKGDRYKKMEKARRQGEFPEPLREAVARLLKCVTSNSPPPIDEETDHRLMSMADLCSVARTAVKRDGYSREIVHVPEPEEPTRLFRVSRTYLQGLELIGLDRKIAMVIIEKVLMDSMQPVRRAILGFMVGREFVSTAEIVAGLTLPRSMSNSYVWRALEDLEALGIIEREGWENSSRWKLSERSRQCLLAFTTFSDNSPMELCEIDRYPAGGEGEESEGPFRPVIRVTAGIDAAACWANLLSLPQSDLVEGCTAVLAVAQGVHGSTVFVSGCASRKADGSEPT